MQMIEQQHHFDMISNNVSGIGLYSRGPDERVRLKAPIMLQWRTDGPTELSLGKRAPQAKALISADLCIVNDCFMRYWTPFT